MIKLAVTIADFAAAVHAGGDVERSTYVVEIENERLEKLLTPPKPNQYFTVSLSVVYENR